MTDVKMLNDIKSAGAWFVCEYAAVIFDKYPKLMSDKIYKGKVIKQIFNECKRDSALGGTRTRVNAVIRIIKRHELEKALQHAIESDTVKRDDPEAVKTAQQTLQKLRQK